MKYFKYIMVFAVGAGAGALAANYFLKDKYAKMADEEILEYKEYADQKIKEIEKRAGTVEGGDEESTPLPESDDDNTDESDLEKKCLEMSTDYSAMFKNDSKPEISRLDLAEKEYPQDDYDEEAEIAIANKNRSHIDPEKPYIITLEEFTNENRYYDKESLTYYAEDDVLTDSNDEIISDPEYHIGDDALVSFGEGSDDEDVVYVRSDRVGIDYEIIRVYKSYSRDILGIEPTNNPSHRKKGVDNED